MRHPVCGRRQRSGPRRRCVENTSGDGGSNGISLSAERTFQASIPVDMTEAEAKEAASSVTWTLTPDADAPDYLDDTQFPNQTEGGPLSAWLCQDGETPFFTDVATAAETVDGQVYLTVTFANQCYFGDDLSVPHSNGGSYMDVCGYFTLSAGLDGKTLGSVDLKVAPYDTSTPCRRSMTSWTRWWTTPPATLTSTWSSSPWARARATTAWKAWICLI